jgi:hypothetical protein
MQKILPAKVIHFNNFTLFPGPIMSQSILKNISCLFSAGFYKGGMRSLRRVTEENEEQEFLNDHFLVL